MVIRYGTRRLHSRSNATAKSVSQTLLVRSIFVKYVQNIYTHNKSTRSENSNNSEGFRFRATLYVVRTYVHISGKKESGRGKNVWEKNLSAKFRPGPAINKKEWRKNCFNFGWKNVAFFERADQIGLFLSLLISHHMMITAAHQLEGPFCLWWKQSTSSTSQCVSIKSSTIGYLKTATLHFWH